MLTKTAIVVGSSGQDGTILSSYLIKKGYAIIGIDKNRPNVKQINISNKKEVYDLIKKTKPAQIYFLAAHHKSSQDLVKDYAEELVLSFNINVFALTNFLEGIRMFSKKTKLFYAGSSLMFGNTGSTKKTELSPFYPDSIYGITKKVGADICRLYREKYGILASVGILFNHESEYRTENFISMKIIKGALDIKKGILNKITVGNLQAKVDWGYAYDFVEAMYLILKNKKADDFIISTGKLHSVKDLIKITFKELGLDWKKYIVEEKKIILESRQPISGNFTKINKITGWKPKHSFEEMIKKIIKQKKYECPSS